MNTQQLERIVRQVCKNDCFIGVYPSNHLPPSAATPSYYVLIANTQACDERGEHWISICVDRRRGLGEYFDSYGLPPNSEFREYLRENCRTGWTYNDKQLQSIVSDVCGHYCAYYCMMKCIQRCISGMNDMLTLFTSDTTFNDSLVRRFISRRLYLQ